MIKEDFISSMVISFAPKQSHEKKQGYINRISALAENCPEIHLQEIYNYAAMQEKYPGIKDLLKFAKEKGFIQRSNDFEKKTLNWYYKCNGFHKDIQTGSGKEGKPILERMHFSCDTNYPKKSKACPNCASTSGSVIVLKEDQSFPALMDAQEYCYRCDKYRPDGKGYGFRVYGPSCGIYGGYNSPENDEQCKSCSCRQCCIDKREYTFNRDSFLHGENGEKKDIVQDWLLPTRRPGSTVINFDKVKKS